MSAPESTEDAFETIVDAALKWADVVAGLNAKEPTVASDIVLYRQILDRAIAQVKHEVWGT
jgi:hypothetical protein